MRLSRVRFSAKKLEALSPWKGATAPTILDGGPRATPRLQEAIKHTAPGVGRMTDLNIVKGKGSFLLTDENQVLLDFASGIGVTNLGHAQPDVVKAVCAQAEDISHAQVNISFHSKQLDLVNKLRKVMPAGLDRFFFWNGGADAVEAAWKLARHATGKKNIIVVKGSYHGRTFATMGMTTSKTIYSAGFGPFVPGVHVVDFPYCLHCKAACSANISAKNECCGAPLEDLELLFSTQSAANDTAAVILEPILGEGGYVPPPKGYLTKLREICTANKVLLIADEVQSGFGRTGQYFAVNDENVIPDILVFAKGVANGHVLSGIASTYDLMQTQPPGSMGGTYAGNAISCAAACATLDVLERDNVLQNVAHRSKQLVSALNALKETYPSVIRDVRGRGLMIGVEFQANLKYEFAAKISKLCLHQGMVLVTASVFPTVRFMPPLNISEEEMALGIEIFSKAIEISQVQQ